MNGRNLGINIWMVFTGLYFSLAVSANPGALRERKLYVGSNSTEATLKFTNRFEFNSDTVPSEDTVKEKIEDQVLHLFGPMAEAADKAVPRGNHTLSAITKPELKAGTKNVYTVSYDYQGTIVLQNGPNTDYTVILPINPDTIYAAAGLVRAKNPCTDDHYNGEGDFWYFWNPYQVGCRLRENLDFVKIRGSINRIPNTKLSYPEYNRLLRNTDQGKYVIVSVFMGMDDPDKFSHNPLKSRDINASNYRAMRNSLLKMKFKEFRPWTLKESSKFVGHSLKKNPYVVEYRKSNRQSNFLVRMFFGPTGMDEESQAFHWFYKQALEESSVVIYDGHSGLGDHLDLSDMEKEEAFKININKNLYQIYYFNSCSSYSYYNTEYFKRKQSSADPKGTKNLDILTNGLATYFSVMHDTNLALVKAILDWSEGRAMTSYQVLAKAIDSNNLFGINGDEDNQDR